MLVAIHLSIYGQTDRVYWNYDISDGLPTNSLYHILIDHTDRIWFGSDYGVTCFDGKTFKTFTVEDGLLDNTVIRCYEDSLHRIWFQHVSSLPTFYENGKIHQLKNQDQGINIPAASFINEPQKGKIIIGGTKDGIGGLAVIEKDLTCKFITSSSKMAIHTLDFNDSAVFFLADRDGALLVDQVFNQKIKNNYHINRFYLEIPFDLDFGAFLRSVKSYDPTDAELAEKYNFKKVYHIKIIGKSKFFATSAGIIEFRRVQNSWRFHKHYLKDVIFVSVDADSQGNFWGTSLNNGLYKIPNVHYKQIELHSNQRNIYSIEHENQIYLEGENLNFSVLTNLQIQTSAYNKLSTNNFKNDPTYDFLFYKQFRVYQKKGDWLVFDAKKRKEKIILQTGNQNGFRNIYQSRITPTSFILYGPSSIGIFHLKKQPFEIKILTNSMGRIKCVIEFGKHLFVGTQKGLFVQDVKDPTKFNPVFGKILGNSRISSLHTSHNTLFIATGDKGVFVYDPYKNVLTPWRKGVLSKGVKGIYPGKNNSFWVHTDLGLQQFTFRNGKWAETQRMDLKTILKVNDVVNIHEIKNTLYVITTNSIFSIPLSKTKTLRKINFHLEGVKINEALRKPTKNLALKHFENNLTFLFSCVNHSAHPATLSYRINGGPWLANNGEVFNFSSLSAGEYVFDFKASSPFYATNFILGQKIKIDRKWWQTNTAIFVAFLLSTSLIVTIVRWRIIKSQEKKRRSLSNELFSLQSQMNPHFTFNSLNSVQSYLSTNDKRSAQIYLADFAILMRKIMDQAKLNLISLNEEIDFLRNYLNLEMRRLEGAFDYEITYDEDMNTENTFVPSLMLQPFIENAVWHGVAALSYKGKIEISFQKINDQLICKIIDNGMGIDENKKQKPFHKSAGINNVRERMRLFEELFNKKIELEIIDLKQNNSHGICVQIIIPKLTLENKLT